MHDFIDIVEQHTNNEISEGAAGVSVLALIVTGVIYCLALLA